MSAILRLLLGVALIPACFGVLRAFWHCVMAAADSGGGFSLEEVSLLGGMLSFGLAWIALPHPVRSYVLGHELTHALWGLFFGACPSDVKVSASGGSVRLTKSNLLITLAPYFFPFYTFIVIVAALVTFAFVRPLPCLPLWMFLIGFTWAFHVLFTLETLTTRQPDITLYGRVFSWTFIFLVNAALVLVWLAAMTSLQFSALAGYLVRDVLSAYAAVMNAAVALFEGIHSLCIRT